MREYFWALALRLERVRVMSGDWSRVSSETVTTKLGAAAMFLDPPYLYNCTASYNHNDDVRSDVRAYCLERGKDPDMRIGSRAEVEFLLDSVSDAIVVPLGAVARDSDGASVTVIDDGEPAERSVKPRNSNGRVVEIEKGCKEGEIVLLARGGG